MATNESVRATLSDGTTVTLSRIDGELVVRLDAPGTDDVPLLYTERGNVPYDSLSHETEWEFGERHIACALVARRKDAVVRREPHVFLLEGLAIGGQSERLN